MRTVAATCASSARAAGEKRPSMSITTQPVCSRDCSLQVLHSHIDAERIEHLDERQQDAGCVAEDVQQPLLARVEVLRQLGEIN